jgi:hypothetical protein
MVDPDNKERLLKVPRHVVAEIEDKAYIEGYKEAEASTLNAILRIIDRNKHGGSCCSVVHTCDLIQEIELIRQTTEDWTDE